MATQRDLPPAHRTIRLTDEVVVTPFLPHAVGATLGVVVLPITIVVAAVYLTAPDPPLPALAALGIALTVAASVLGTLLWQRVDESDAIEFGELMLWVWDRRNRAEKRVHETAVELGLDAHGHATKLLPRARRLELLKELTDALQEKDAYTRGHSQRVERLTNRTALALGLTAEQTKIARTAASVHDVGKVSVPDEILRKPEGLTELEFATMKEHAPRGARMVESVGNRGVTEAVRHHHERWDGRGYPEGLVAHEIPLAARIIAVADTFDALTSTRTYRPRSSRRAALRTIEAEAGKQLDPEIVPVFVGAMRERAAVYYVPALFSFLPEGWANLSSWWRRRSDVLAAAALALVAAVASGAMFGEDAVPEATVAAPAEIPASEAPSNQGFPAGRGSDGRSRGDTQGRLEDPPADTDTVLGTRIEATTSDGPGDHHRARRDGRDRPRLDRQPADPASREPGPAAGSTWPPGHRDRAPDDGPPGRSKPGTGRVRDPAPEHGRDCDGNPGRGRGRGRMHHC